MNLENHREIGRRRALHGGESELDGIELMTERRIGAELVVVLHLQRHQNVLALRLEPVPRAHGGAAAPTIRCDQAGDVAQVVDERMVVAVGIVSRVERRAEECRQMMCYLAEGFDGEGMRVVLVERLRGEARGGRFDQRGVAWEVRERRHALALECDPVGAQVAELVHGAADVACAREIDGGAMIGQAVAVIENVADVVPADVVGQEVRPCRKRAAIILGRAPPPLYGIAKTEIDPVHAAVASRERVGKLGREGTWGSLEEENRGLADGHGDPAQRETSRPSRTLEFNKPRRADKDKRRARGLNRFCKGARC